MLVILGVVATGLTYLGGRGLLVLGRHGPGSVGTLLATIGQLAAVGSPLGGLPALKLFADRAGARVSATGFTTVLLAGVATLVALALLIGWH